MEVLIILAEETCSHIYRQQAGRGTVDDAGSETVLIGVIILKAQ